MNKLVTTPTRTLKEREKEREREGRERERNRWFGDRVLPLEVWSVAPAKSNLLINETTKETTTGNVRDMYQIHVCGHVCVCVCVSACLCVCVSACLCIYITAGILFYCRFVVWLLKDRQVNTLTQINTNTHMPSYTQSLIRHFAYPQYVWKMKRFIAVGGSKFKY